MSLPKLKTAVLVLLIAGFVLAAGLVTYHTFGKLLGHSNTPPVWRADPALQTRLKTEFAFTPREAEDEQGMVQRSHYSLIFPDGAEYSLHHLGMLPIEAGLQGKLPVKYESSNEENFFVIPGGGLLLVYVKRASPEERAGKPFERSWNELQKQHQVGRNFGGLEHGDIEEGIVNGSTFYRARVTCKGSRGYAYVSYDGEQVIYLVFRVLPNQNGSEDAEKLAEAVVLTWQKHNDPMPPPRGAGKDKDTSK
jgi:hypothetical protein